MPEIVNSNASLNINETTGRKKLAQRGGETPPQRRELRLSPRRRARADGPAPFLKGRGREPIGVGVGETPLAAPSRILPGFGLIDEMQHDRRDLGLKPGQEKIAHEIVARAQ